MKTVLSVYVKGNIPGNEIKLPRKKEKHEISFTQFIVNMPVIGSLLKAVRGKFWVSK